MTQRKPPGVSWETWIDRQIRVGMEAGAFDDLPGTGRPVPDIDRPRDEMWWVRDKVRREGVTSVPPAVAVRREMDATVVAIAAATSEDEVRHLVATINERVRGLNSRPVSGPPSTVAPLDAEVEVAAWRAARPRPDPGAPPSAATGAGEHAPPGAGAPPAAPRPRRWLRWRRRRR
jgi:hypothetical protein